MPRFFSKLKSLVGHAHLLEGAILLAFCMFSIQPGAVGDVMRGCTLIFLLWLVLGIYRISHFNAAAVVMIGGFLVMLAVNLAAPEGAVHSRSLSYFMAFPGMAMAVHALTVAKREKPGAYSHTLYTVVVAAAVLINAAVLLLLHKSNPFGVYSNPHDLGLFTSLTLPVLILFLTALRKSWARLVLGGVILIDLLLLFESNSKVSWLAFAVGIGFAVLYFLKGRSRIVTVAGLVLMSLLGSIIYGLPRIASRLQFFLAHLTQEARWTLWADTWKLLMDSSLAQWLFGHGIGSFRYYITEYATVGPSGTTPHFSFPHNGLFQIWFENGLIGCLIVFGGFLALAICLMKGYAVLRSDKTRYLLITLFAVMSITFIHFMLTKSYYSKYIQFVLSIVVGIALAVIDEIALSRKVRLEGVR